MGPSDMLAVLDAVHEATDRTSGRAVPIARVDMPIAYIRQLDRRGMLVMIDGYVGLTTLGECERNKMHGLQWRRIGVVEAAVLNEPDNVREVAAAVDLCGDSIEIGQIAEKSGYSPKYTRAALARLQKLGLVTSTGFGTARRWSPCLGRLR